MSDSERAVTLPAHLWEALDTMAKEMGVSADALVGQAVFTLARLNGYVVPGKVQHLGGGAAVPAVAPVAGPKAAAAGPGARAPATSTKGAPLPSKRRPEPEPEPEPEPPADDYPQDEQSNPFEDRGADDEPPPEEEPAEEPPPEEEPAEEPEPPPPPPSKKGGGATALTLTMTGRDPFKLQGDSMIIGRGKHCDFVIESNRVSREHCRISKEGADWVLEDLNSSNGTFFGPGKEKVSRRKIKDGDEFTFGTEKVKFSLRAR